MTNNTQILNSILDKITLIGEEVLQTPSKYNVSYGWLELESLLSTEDIHVNKTFKHLFKYILYAIYTFSEVATILWPAVIILMYILLTLILLGRLLLVFVGFQNFIQKIKRVFYKRVGGSYEFCIKYWFHFARFIFYKRDNVETPYEPRRFVRCIFYKRADGSYEFCIKHWTRFVFYKRVNGSYEFRLKYWLHFARFIFYKSNNIDGSYEGMHVVRAANLLNCLCRIMRCEKYLLCDLQGAHIRLIYIYTNTYTEVCILHRPEIHVMQKTFKSHTRAAFLLLLNFIVMSAAIYSSGRMVNFWGVTIKFMCSIGLTIFVHSYYKTYAKRSEYTGSLYLMITWELMEQGNVYLHMENMWKHKAVSFRSQQVVHDKNMQHLAPQVVARLLRAETRILDVREELSQKIIQSLPDYYKKISQIVKEILLSEYGDYNSDEIDHKILRNVQQKNFLLSLAKESWSNSMKVQKKATDAYNNATLAFVVSIILTTMIILLPRNNAVAVDIIMGVILGILATALIEMFNGTRKFANSVTMYKEAGLMLARANSQPSSEGLLNITKDVYSELIRMSLHNLNIENETINNNQQLKECTPEWCTERIEHNMRVCESIFYLEKTTDCSVDNDNEIEDANNTQSGTEINIYNCTPFINYVQSQPGKKLDLSNMPVKFILRKLLRPISAME